MVEYTINGRTFEVRLGEQQALEVDGTTYTLSKFTDIMMRQWLAWAKSKLPNPLEELADLIHRFPEHLHQRMYDDAKKKAEQRGKDGDDETGAMFTSPEGQAYCLVLMLKKGQPMTDDKAVDVATKALDQHGTLMISGVVAKAQGVIPLAESEVERDFFRKFGLDTQVRRPNRKERRAATSGKSAGKSGR